MRRTLGRSPAPDARGTEALMIDGVTVLLLVALLAGTFVLERPGR